MNASSSSLLGYRLPYIRPQLAQLSEGLQKEAAEVIKNYNGSNASGNSASNNKEPQPHENAVAAHHEVEAVREGKPEHK